MIDHLAIFSVGATKCDLTTRIYIFGLKRTLSSYETTLNYLEAGE